MPFDVRYLPRLLAAPLEALISLVCLPFFAIPLVIQYFSIGKRAFSYMSMWRAASRLGVAGT